MALKQWEKIELSDVLSSEALNIVKTQYYYVPDNCTVGTTVVLDGIECLCIATGVTIQGSTLTRIAVDKNHDLGYYQKYVGMNLNGAEISQIMAWRWGGYGTETGTSQEVGYGLQNTIKCLANTVNYGKGTYTGTKGDGYPWLWQGVNDFRASHSDKWFVPSYNELLKIYAHSTSLKFDTTTGGSSNNVFCSSSEDYDISGHPEFYSYSYVFHDGSKRVEHKYDIDCVRLCRAF